MYKLLSFKFRRHLCKGSIIANLFEKLGSTRDVENFLLFINIIFAIYPKAKNRLRILENYFSLDNWKTVKYSMRVSNDFCQLSKTSV